MPSQERCVSTLWPGFLGPRDPLQWENVKGDGVPGSEKALKSQNSPGSQIQCSATSFWNSLTTWSWERSVICVAIFLLVMLALRLQLPCFCISTYVTMTGCSVCFSFGCCSFPLRVVLFWKGLGVGEALEGWREVATYVIQLYFWQWWLLRHSCGLFILGFCWSFKQDCYRLQRGRGGKCNLTPPPCVLQGLQAASTSLVSSTFSSPLYFLLPFLTDTTPSDALIFRSLELVCVLGWVLSVVC